MIVRWSYTFQLYQQRPLDDFLAYRYESNSSSLSNSEGSPRVTRYINFALNVRLNSIKYDRYIQARGTLYLAVRPNPFLRLLPSYYVPRQTVSWLNHSQEYPQLSPRAGQLATLIELEVRRGRDLITLELGELLHHYRS
jgi:hypothetical protein